MIAKLIELIPRANFVDSSGTPRFIGSATAPVNVDHWTMDISHNLSKKDRLHGFYAIQQRETNEPSQVWQHHPRLRLHRPIGAADLYPERDTHVRSCGWSTKRALDSTAGPPEPRRMRNSTRPTSASVMALASPSDCRRSALPAAV